MSRQRPCRLRDCGSGILRSVGETPCKLILRLFCPYELLRSFFQDQGLKDLHIPSMSSQQSYASTIRFVALVNVTFFIFTVKLEPGAPFPSDARHNSTVNFSR